jgi:hypothetical protein
MEAYGTGALIAFETTVAASSGTGRGSGLLEIAMSPTLRVSVSISGKRRRQNTVTHPNTTGLPVVWNLEGNFASRFGLPSSLMVRNRLSDVQVCKDLHRRDDEKKASWGTRKQGLPRACGTFTMSTRDKGHGRKSLTKRYNGTCYAP